MNKQGDGTELIATSAHLKTGRRGKNRITFAWGVRGCRGKRQERPYQNYQNIQRVTLSFQISETEGKMEE